MARLSPNGSPASYDEGMPPRARARSRSTPGPSALSEADVALLRERLDSGKRPRVTLLVDTALGSAGTSVAVVSFGEPAEGEFISVRLRDDVVPFSPTELAMPVRGRATATPLPLADAERPAARVQPYEGLTPAPTRPAKAARTSQPAHSEPPASQPASPARLVAVPEPAAAPALPAAEPVQPKAAATPATPATPPASTKATSRRPARAGGLSVTVRYGAQGWTYESTRSGRRSAARPLNLAAIRAFADRLDDPSLRRDLQVAIDVCRDQARTRVETLRAELERVEVELAELDE